MSGLIRQYTLDAQSNPVAMFLENRDKYDLDPPCQRGAVWGMERKRNLIKSLYMGLPVGAMFINRRKFPDDWTVIDGKQRILAMRSFVDGEFAVPGGWFGDDYDLELNQDYYWGGLSDKARRVFESGCQLAVYYVDFNGPEREECEQELFELINFGGVAQGESDLG